MAAAYSSTRFDETAYAKLLQETLGMDDLITKHAAIMDKYDPEKKVPLVVDEWGVWLETANAGSHPGFLQQQNSLRDAIVAALNINIFARHADRVRMTNIAQMINVLQAMILTDKDKMVLTPTYHVFEMYVPFQDATLVPVSFDKGSYAQGDIKLPRIDATAVRDTQGKLWLAVTNLDPTKSATIAVNLVWRSRRPAPSGQVLTAPRVDAVNTFDAPNAVTPKPYTAKASAKGLDARRFQPSPSWWFSSRTRGLTLAFTGSGSRRRFPCHEWKISLDFSENLLETRRFSYSQIA
jgi:alpha-N-arabinofuranosidase